MTPAATAARTGLSAQLAAARESAQAGQLKLVTFCIGGEEYGVDIMAVREINRMTEFTRVPESPPDVEGVINLRGRIVPVFDLRKRFGMPAAERTSSSRVMVVEISGRVFGFIVDRVSQAGLEVQAGVVDPPPAMACSIGSDYLAGVAKLQDRLVILLDLEKLFEGHLASRAA